MAGGSRELRVRRFTDLEVWRRAHRLFLDLADDLDQVTRRRIADVLVHQVCRSIGSISANISEGFNRSRAKYLNSLDIALGEAHETENWLYKLRDTNLLTSEVANTRIQECIEIQRMLVGLIKSIRAEK